MMEHVKHCPMQINPQRWGTCCCDALRAAVAEATAELRMVMACGHVVANMAEKDGQGYCLFCSAVEVWQAKLAEAETNNDICRGNYEGLAKELDAARTALAEERERCRKAICAICEGCRKGWPVVRAPWCDAWHSDEPSVPTSGMPCKAAALRAQEGKA